MTQLTALNFNCGQELWVKIAWDHPPEFRPGYWNLNKRDEPKQILLRGIFSSEPPSFQRCKWNGFDEDGDSIWMPTEEDYSFAHIAQLADDGATIHFYPNQPQGGISNKHVQRSQVVFYEIDSLELDAQWQAIAWLSHALSLMPALTVFTGGKSLHVYFKLAEPIEAQTHWRRLARKLCIIQNADNKVTNPARAMRLAGVVRRKMVDGVLQAPVPITVEQWSRHVYTAEQFEAALDSSELFPYGLSEERWSEWVAARNKRLLGADIDPTDVLSDADLDNRTRDRQIKTAQSTVLSSNPQMTDFLVQDALSHIPARTPGGNTYEIYRTLLMALAGHYGEDEAIAVMERHSPSRTSGWNPKQICKSSKAKYSIGTFFYTAQEHFGWKRPDTSHFIIDPAIPPDFNAKTRLVELGIEIDSELEQLLTQHSDLTLHNAVCAFEQSQDSIAHPLPWVKRAIQQGWKPRKSRS